MRWGALDINLDSHIAGPRVGDHAVQCVIVIQCVILIQNTPARHMSGGSVRPPRFSGRHRMRLAYIRSQLQGALLVH